MQPVQNNEDVVPRNIPLIPGAIYQLIPSMGGQYIVLTSVDRRYAYASGYGPHFADIKVRKKRLPGNVIRLLDTGFVSTSALLLTGEPGYVRMLDGSRIGLFTN